MLEALDELVVVRPSVTIFIGDAEEQKLRYVAMRACKNPDAFPSSDLGLLRAFDTPDGERIKAKELNEMSQAWRPWRAYAAQYLWRAETPAQPAAAPRAGVRGRHKENGDVLQPHG